MWPLSDCQDDRAGTEISRWSFRAGEVLVVVAFVAATRHHHYCHDHHRHQDKAGTVSIGASPGRDGGNRVLKAQRGCRRPCRNSPDNDRRGADLSLLDRVVDLPSRLVTRRHSASSTVVSTRAAGTLPGGPGTTGWASCHCASLGLQGPGPQLRVFQGCHAARRAGGCARRTPLRFLKLPLQSSPHGVAGRAWACTGRTACPQAPRRHVWVSFPHDSPR